MSELADTNLVLAAINPNDALHQRAREHVSTVGPLVVTPVVGAELLLVARKVGANAFDLVGAAELHFHLENRDVLYDAADELENGEVGTVFDALHVAEAQRRSVTLHTADRSLLQSAFPTTEF